MSSPSPVVLTSRPLWTAMVGSISSARMALSAWSVPLSSAPISREYPATSAARIAARRRVVEAMARAGPPGFEDRITLTLPQLARHDRRRTDRAAPEAFPLGTHSRLAGCRDDLLKSKSVFPGRRPLWASL